MNYAKLNKNISLNQNQEYIDKDCVIRLNRICKETGAYVVITSHWRNFKTINEIQRTLEKFGFTGKVIGKTAKTEFGTAYEINLYYFNNKDIIDYIVLDPDNINSYSVSGSQIKTDFNGDGLTDRHVQMAIDMLKGKEYYI